VLERLMSGVPLDHGPRPLAGSDPDPDARTDSHPDPDPHGDPHPGPDGDLHPGAVSQPDADLSHAPLSPPV